MVVLFILLIIVGVAGSC
ncbi:YjcZ family sporulation protein [Bacillus nitratireducens]